MRLFSVDLKSKGEKAITAYDYDHTYSWGFESLYWIL